MSTKEQQAVELLNEIIEWWEKWCNSGNPTELENPPIEQAKQLVAEFYKEV